MVDWLAGWKGECLVGWKYGWLAGLKDICLAGWKYGWLIGRLIGRLDVWLVRSMDG